MIRVTERPNFKSCVLRLGSFSFFTTFCQRSASVISLPNLFCPIGMEILECIVRPQLLCPLRVFPIQIFKCIKLYLLFEISFKALKLFFILSILIFIIKTFIYKNQKSVGLSLLRDTTACERTRLTALLMVNFNNLYFYRDLDDKIILNVYVLSLYFI